MDHIKGDFSFILLFRGKNETATVAILNDIILPFGIRLNSSVLTPLKKDS